MSRGIGSKLATAAVLGAVLALGTSRGSRRAAVQSPVATRLDEILPFLPRTKAPKKGKPANHYTPNGAREVARRLRQMERLKRRSDP